MKRLVDQGHLSGSPEQFLASAIRATPRLEPEPFEMQRVLARVTSASRRGRAVLLRAAVTAAFILVALAATAAVVVRARATSPSQPPAASSALSLAPVAMPPASATPPEPSAPAVPEQALEETAAAPAASAPIPTPRLAAPPKDGEDPTQVLQAIRALRHDGDPAHAGALLSQYLGTHPHGVLTEDALALSIEAANARHDARAAADFGRRYLAQFPRGRYRAVALQAVQPAAR